MTRRWRATGFLVLGIAVVSALVGWWRVGGTESPSRADAPHSETTAPSSVWHHVPKADAGVGEVRGLVHWEDGSPAASVTVSLYSEPPELLGFACETCDQPAIECSEASTVRLLGQALDAGILRAAGAPEAVTTTDANGQFQFSGVRLRGLIRAREGSASAWVEAGPAPELQLSRAPVVVTVFDRHTADPIAGARVRLLDLFEGTERFSVTDGAGELTLPASSDSWAIIEHDGHFPSGTSLTTSTRVSLGRPQTLQVRVLLGEQPVDAEVVLTEHGRNFRKTAKNGTVTFTDVGEGQIAVMAFWKDLVSSREELMILDSSARVDLQLHTAGRLVLSVTSEDGEPLPSVGASLSQADSEVREDAENGALVVFDRVPVGEHELEVVAAGHAEWSRTIEVTPSETRLDVVLHRQSPLAGIVVDARGKPVPQARIRLIDGSEEIAVTSDPDGHFHAWMAAPGPVRVTVLSRPDGVLDQTVVAPATELRLVLQEKGVLELDYFDHDGSRIDGLISIRSRTDGAVFWATLAGDVSPAARVAGLPSGTYVLVRTVTGRLLVNKEFTIEEGKVTHLEIRAEVGATIRGRVKRADDSIPDDGAVQVAGGTERADLSNDGTFVLSGLPTGKVRLLAFDRAGLESPETEVTAPSTGVTLILAARTQVSGRVLDTDRRPLSDFSVEDRVFHAADGHFELTASGKVVTFAAEGFQSVTLPAKSSMGDVVLERVQRVRGIVVDEAGKGVEGATVRTVSSFVTQVTGRDGSFELEADRPCELLVTLGTKWARGACEANSTRLTLHENTVVVGRVLSSAGQGVESSVRITCGGELKPVEVRSDAEGRFEVRLRPDVCLFAVKKTNLGRFLQISGDRTEVLLGSAGDCQASLVADGRLHRAWFLPGQEGEGAWTDPERIPGAVVVESKPSASTLEGRGLPCGPGSVLADIDNLVVWKSVVLTASPQTIELHKNDSSSRPKGIGTTGGVHHE